MHLLHCLINLSDPRLIYGRKGEVKRGLPSSLSFTEGFGCYDRIYFRVSSNFLSFYGYDCFKFISRATAKEIKNYAPVPH